MAAAIELDVESQKRVEEIAEIRHKSPHVVIREAIEEYALREETREQFRQDAVASLEHYESTGLHLIDDEVDEWFAKLAAGEDAKMPKCHT